MISTVQTGKGSEAITSDRWHVVHARFVGNEGIWPFVRSISSEHDDRTSCVEAARALMARIRREAGAVPLVERDQVFVRKPGFKSVRSAKRRPPRAQRKPNGDAT